ncbi:MFS transporter [Rothia sp. P5766]|uniref:MFS transporter n=1 Tax=Rothia sp. P5766 TaxID=3402656 RepID=UPI003AEA0EC6
MPPVTEARRKTLTYTFEGYRGGSREYRRLLTALFAAGVATFAQLYSPQPLIPQIARDLAISADRAALTISCSTAGLALCTLLWAALADRWGRVRTMTLALCGATLLGLITPWIQLYPLLLVLRTFEGAFLGGVAGLAVAVIVTEAHISVRAAAAGLYISGTSVGGLIGRLLSGALTELLSWRVAMFSVSFTGFMAALIFIVLMPASHDRPCQRAAASAPYADSSWAKVGALLRNRQEVTLFTAGFALMGAFVSIYNYIGFKLQAAPYHLSPFLLSFIFLIYLLGTVSSGFGGKLAQRGGLKRVFLAACLLMAGGILLTLARPLPLVIAGLALLTAAFFAAHALASGWAGALAGPAKSQATALYNSFYYGGSALIGWGAGLLLPHAGWEGLALSCTALVFFCCLLSALYLPSQGADTAG